LENLKEYGVSRIILKSISNQVKFMRFRDGYLYTGVIRLPNDNG